MMTQQRQKYDREFKRKAVELSFARGNGKEIAKELGIRPELLYRWRREYQRYENNSFPGQGKLIFTIACDPGFFHSCV
jgi:transposase